MSRRPGGRTPEDGGPTGGDRTPEGGGEGVGPAEHPALALDDTVHQRVRLGILTVLSETKECKFGTLRDELGLTDGNLNRHLRVLEQAGMLQVIKGYEGRRPSTWLRLTRQGRAALRAEIAALEQLVSRLRAANADRPDDGTDA